MKENPGEAASGLTRISVEQTIESLLGLAWESGRNAPLDAYLNEPGVSEKMVREELCVFSVFVVDFATYRFFRSRDCELGQLIREGLQDLAYKKVLKERSTRLAPYVLAVRTPHENGPAWTSAVAFSHQCGLPESFDLIMMASNQFAALFSATRRALSQSLIEGTK